MDNTLQHHGILGMKWGIRRFQNKDGTLTSAGKRREVKANSDDSKAVKELRKRKLNSLSNVEIRKLNERLQLERQYNDLTKRKLIVGEKTSMKILSRIGDRILNKVVDKGVDSAVEKMFGK